MYLLAFVMIIIGMLSVYTQVLAVQTARLAAAQTTAADTMITWHNAATTVIDITDPAFFSNPANITAAGCSLTPATPIPLPAFMPPPCKGGADIIQNANLPPGNTAYHWYSVAYRPAPSNALQIITWAPPPASSRTSDSITAPAININLSDLYHQLQNTNYSPFLYGTVTNTVPPLLVTPVGVIPGGSPLNYNVPTGAVAVGSVGVISLR